MSAEVTPLDFQPRRIEEDEARAGYYALLARLYYAGPDAALLETIAGADEIAAAGEQTGLASAWSALARAARAMDAEAARLEYDGVFVGTGKAEVTPYATFYLAESGREKILVRLKNELAALGLSKTEGAREPEDHVAALFEVMRHLISEGCEDAALQKQKVFFHRYIEPFFPPFCDAISASAKSNFYKYVGAFTCAFLQVETESLKVF
ncbi:MAG TPA: molecular chaperone TorD family protein [Burkholderiales bacterium]|nr:molecular chaperone TorD family protein [Burkholderiales bacterium]